MPRPLLCVALVLLLASDTHAGQVFLGESATHYVKIEVEGDRVVGRWQVPRRTEPSLPKSGSGFYNSVAMALSWIPPGAYRLGTAPGRQGVSVEISRGFWMGAHEVTQEQYEQIGGQPPARFIGDHRPVERVTWDEAREFCERLTAVERTRGRIPSGWSYRLPTEAEWEYAVRAGTEGPRFLPGAPRREHCEDALLERVAWFCGNSRTDDPADHDASRWSLKGQSGYFGTHVIGRKHPNPWGLYDVYGNVEEWCLDSWFPDHTGAFADGRPRGAVTVPGERVLRGGSWLSGSYRIRTTARRGLAQDLRRPDVGFRVVLAPGIPGGISGSLPLPTGGPDPLRPAPDASRPRGDARRSPTR